MNYLKIYNSLIATRKLMGRKKYNGTYFESHHIIPLSVGGENISQNKVLLTPREHFLAHLLLPEIYNIGKNKSFMVAALYIMCCIKKRGGNEYKVSSRLYERVRNEYIEWKKTQVYPFLGRKHSEATKDKIRQKTKLWYKAKSPEQIKQHGDLISAAQISKGTNKHNKETRLKMSVNSSNKKIISQFTKEGLLINEHISLIEAAKVMGVKVASICDGLKGRSKTVKGCILKYKKAA